MKLSDGPGVPTLLTRVADSVTTPATLRRERCESRAPGVCPLLSALIPIYSAESEYQLL